MCAGSATVGSESGSDMNGNRVFDWPLDTPIHEAIGQAIGAASMCWSQPSAGVFLSDRASQIADELLDLIYRKRLV
jgi:hypothetical protein